MKALEGEKTDNPLLVNLLEKSSRLCERADIVFCWLPSHIGISGNEKADKAAKDALSLEVLSIKVPYNDFKPLINYLLRNVCSNPGAIKTTNFSLITKSWRMASRIADKWLRRNYLSLSLHRSFIYNALLSPERRRASMYTLQCTFYY